MNLIPVNEYRNIHSLLPTPKTKEIIGVQNLWGFYGVDLAENLGKKIFSTPQEKQPLKGKEATRTKDRKGIVGERSLHITGC